MKKKHAYIIYQYFPGVYGRPIPFSEDNQVDGQRRNEDGPGKRVKTGEKPAGRTVDIVRGKPKTNC